MEWQKGIDTPKQLFELAYQISAVIAAGDVVFLTGDLGAGKTTFCQALFRALGYEDLVKSPTYTLVEPYIIADQHYFHFDLYRVRDPMELYSMGIDDYFMEDSIVLVEWPEKGRGVLPAPSLTLNLFIQPKDRRLAIIYTNDDKFIDLFNRMDQDNH